MHLSEIWHSKKNDCRLSRTQVNRYGHTLHCIAHKSVQLRSIVYHLAALNPFHSLRSIFFSSAERQWLSTPVAVRYVPHPFVHCCERILRYIPLRYHSGVSLWLCEPWRSPTLPLHYIPLHIHSLRVRQCLLFPIRLRLHGLVKRCFLLSANARKPSDLWQSRLL